MGEEPVDVRPAVPAARLEHELRAVLDDPEAPTRLFVHRPRVWTERDRIEKGAKTEAGVCMPRLRVAVGDAQHQVRGGARVRRGTADANPCEHRLDADTEVLERRREKQV